MKSWDEIHKATATFSKRWKNATDSVSLVREWLYNRRSELTAATVGTNLYDYSYDTIGNRLWSAANLATNTYVANALNQYTSVGRGVLDPPQTSALIYDADGNMTRDGRFLYSYDAENRLRSIISSVVTNGALRVQNAYDHRNRRIRKTVQRLSVSVAQPPAPPVEIREWQTLETHTFVWDGNNIVLEKVDFADGTTRTFEYFWGMDKSGTEQDAGGVEGLLAVSMDGVFYIPCYDHNGNIVLYISETGGIAAQYTYDPYGNIIESSGPLADVFSFGFSTQYHDRETGMVGYKRRFYRPDLGRWLNRDPVEEYGGINLYGFCGNDAVSNVDTHGLMSVWGYSPEIHGPTTDALTRFGDSVRQNSKEPSFWEQFGTAARTLHQEEFFERRYPSLLKDAKKYFTRNINLCVQMGNCSSDFVSYNPLVAAYQAGGGNIYYPLMRADDNGIYMSDTPQDWSERWLSLGNFYFCVELPVSIRYECDGRKKVKKFSWETYIYVADDLGLTKDDGWLYYATLGFLPGGGLAPPRRIIRARWPLKGEGECECK